MVDYNILFKSQPADLMRVAERDAALEGQRVSNAAQMAQIGNALFNQQQGMRDEERKQMEFQLKDMALDAIKIRPLLESGDTLRANVLIAERIKKIQQRGGDPSDTMAFRDALNSGQITPQQAIGELDSVLEGARQAGVLEGASSASMRSYEPRPMVDENGNFTGYAIPIVDAAGNTRMQPIPGSERAMSPIDLAAARENIGVQGYGQRRQIEAQTAPIIAGGERRAQLGVESEIRPQLEAQIEESKTTAKLDAERKGSIIKAINDEKEVGRILDMAEPLLQKATESLAGATMDAAGRLVGVSTEGSRAAAQLKTLEGALVMKMPRMEGPQSNMDQQLYRQMAAQIGDAGTPSEERQAAVDILRMLNAKYSGQQSPNGSVPPPPSGWSIKKVQ